MAIRSYVKNGKMLYEAYINGNNSRGTRVYRKRKWIATRRRAEQIEFELKRTRTPERSTRSSLLG